MIDTLSKYSYSILALVIICFFLPFYSVSCQGQKVARISGMQLIRGAEAADYILIDEPRQGSSNRQSNDSDRIEPQSKAIAALGCIVLGMICAVPRSRALKVVPAMLSTAAVALLAWSLYSFREDNFKQDQTSKPPDIRVAISVDPEFGFQLACGLLVASAILNGAIYAHRRQGTANVAMTSQPLTSLPPA